MNMKYKNSTKNDYAVNLLTVLLSVMLIFMGAKFFGNKMSIVTYALSIAVCYCKIAIDSIEKIMSKKFDSSIIATASIFIIFASQNFYASAFVAAVYSFLYYTEAFIKSLFSDKLLSDDDYKISYKVLCDEKEKITFADDLKVGDKVLVEKGDFLAFDYVAENGEKGEKNYKSGVFNLSDSAVVTVTQIKEYEIDFDYPVKEKVSNAENIATVITKVYTVLAIVIALLMFVLKYQDTNSLVTSLYTLGMYLLFATPASCFSGITFAGLFTIKALKQDGLDLKDTSEAEKLSRVKKIVFENEGVVTLENDNFNTDVIKAVKIADVLNVKTALVSSDTKERTASITKTCGFSESYFECDEQTKSDVLVESAVQNTVAYVSKNTSIDAKKVVSVCVENSDTNSVKKDKLLTVVKAINKTKVFKLFALARASVGAFVNFVAIAIFASGIGEKVVEKIFVNSPMAVTKDGVDTSLKAKLLKVIICNDMLAPWLIVCVQIALVLIFLLSALAFLNSRKNEQ